MEILFGIGLVLFLECLAWLAWRSWYRATRPTQQPPPTPEQMANEEAFEYVQEQHPRAVRLRLRRRSRRGYQRKIIDE